MNINLFKTILFISLFINGVMFGIAGYRYVTGEDETVEVSVPQPYQQSYRTDPKHLFRQKQFYGQIRDQREQIQHEQTKILNLLQETVPDYHKIDSSLENINQLRADIQRRITYQIIDDMKSLSEEEKENYIEKLQQRFHHSRRRHHERRFDLNLKPSIENK